MTVSYRITSGIALGALFLNIATEFLPVASQRHIPEAVEGALWLDPCSLWEQIPAMAKLLGVLCFGAFLFFLVQGLRNRPGPRWFAIVGVPAFVLQIDWWRVNARCYGTPGLVGLFTWLGAVELMLLHHAVQPWIQLQDRRLRTAVYRSVVQAFFWTPVVWSLLNWVGVSTRDRGGPVSTAQHYIAWAALILFPLAAAVGLRAAATTRKGKSSL